MTLSSASRFLAAAIVLGSLISTPQRAEADDVLVFAAASLKNALDSLVPGFERQSGQEVVISYAASSILARQIQQGAPADVYISANSDWMDVLQENRLIDAGSRVNLLGNGLVLIGGPTAVEIEGFSPQTDISAALSGGHLAMALVDAVPAGIYGKAALQNLGLWDSVQQQVAQTDNVRAALALVAAGAAPLGVVYRSDAQAEDRVRVVASFPANLHPEIVYPAAVTTQASAEANAFLSYLQTDAAMAVFAEQGFALPGD